MFLEQDLTTPRSQRSRAGSTLSMDDVSMSRNANSGVHADGASGVDDAKLVAELQEKMKLYKQSRPATQERYMYV